MACSKERLTASCKSFAMSKKAYRAAISELTTESPITSAINRRGVFDESHGILSAEHVASAISKYGWSQMRATLSGIWGDKLFLAFLTLSVAGFGYVGIRELIRLRRYQKQLIREEKSRIAALSRYKTLEVDGGVPPKEGSVNGHSSRSNATDDRRSGVDAAQLSSISGGKSSNVKGSQRRQRKPSLFQQLSRLLKIAIPNPSCYTAQLLVVQFFMLVTRTFLSINCVKNSISAITHAISGASWKWWTRWLTNFTLWMTGGIIINSGLRMGESLIALHIRTALTNHVHKMYFRGINFYKVNSQAPIAHKAADDHHDDHHVETPATPSAAGTAGVAPLVVGKQSSGEASTPSSSAAGAGATGQDSTSVTPTTPTAAQSPIAQQMHVSAIENRIVRDIANFSDNIAFLYGHSFKPILEFILSLSEASTDLGFKRPLTLFAVSVIINLSMRRFAPHLGRMIAIESENEGQLQQSHTRIASHVEEIAFMGGGSTEEVLISEKLDQLLFTRIKHTLMRVRKSIADNIVKFSGILIGGVFVHIPFILAKNMSPTERMANFRSCEEVMLRCGGAFSEVLLLGRELQEIGGHCSRITEMLDALRVCDQTSDIVGSPSSSAMGSPSSADKSDTMIMCSSDGCKITSKTDHLQNYNKRSSSGTGLKRSTSGMMLIDDSMDSIVMDKVTVVPPEDHAAYVEWFVSTAKNRANALPYEPFSGRILIANLNLTIPQGRSVLITGPNGCGKTSLFRCLAGLWPIGSGYLYRPSGGVMMVPQNPYLIHGTLRDNVTYPILYRLDDGSSRKSSSDASSTSNVVYISEEEMGQVDTRVSESLDLACGANIIRQQSEGLYTVAQWDAKLSGGERQKVGLARVFYHRPVYALLDEATSAVHPGDEATMYSNVTNANITVFSIAHRLALRRYHQLELIYAGDGQGGYEVKQLHA